MTHRSTFAIPPLARAAVAFTLAAALAAPAAAQEYRLGIVTFLSGGAAGPFGIPARNAAELVIDTLNAGKLPAPYNTKGIAGRQIAPIVIDEAGGASKQVTEYRNLVQKQGVDAVIGYISSGDCLAVAPVAEELKKLTIFFDCGTPRIFEERSYSHLFRTGPTAAMDGHLVKISASGPMPTSRYWLHQPLATRASFTFSASGLLGRRAARSSPPPAEPASDPRMARTSARTASAREASPRQRSSMTRSSMERT